MQPKSSSAIIIRSNDNKVFVGKRSFDKKYCPGEWETIGGANEARESPEDGLKREIFEELGAKIKSYKFFRNYYYFGRIFKTFIVELKGEPKPNKEDFTDWGWFSKDKIEKMDFAINCKQKILDYFKAQKS